MYYYKLSDYLKEKYGAKIRKLTLSGGMTCPNRDGTCGTGGCIFCSEGGSGEFAEEHITSVDTQIERAKAKLTDVKEDEKFIAYFQPYSNTYQSVDYLENLFFPVVNRDDVIILSIATRPDCLSDDIIAMLSKLNKIKSVWVELGLQTTNKNTARFIRRGYSLEVYADAVMRLKTAGITVITHLILGLPNETKADMIASARYVGKLTDGIKFHMLYVQKGTLLERMYMNGSVELLSREEYINILCDCIRVIPNNVVIHRITGDADKSLLVAPTWTTDKIKVLNEINNALYDKNVSQGEYLNK